MNIYLLTLLVVLAGCGSPAGDIDPSGGNEPNTALSGDLDDADKRGFFGKFGVGGSAKKAVQEKALWTVGDTPMKLRCPAPASMGFVLSDGMNARNNYMLARFAALGGEALKFESSTVKSFLRSPVFLT